MKKLKRQLVLYITVILFLFVAFSANAAPKPLELSYPTIPGIGITLTENTTLPDLINYLFAFSIVISGIIAFASLVYAGFLFLASGANPGLRLTAKRRIGQVFTGLVLLLGTFILLNVINPDLTILVQQGIAPAIPDEPDEIDEPAGTGGTSANFGTLRYGGVILYEGAPSTALGGNDKEKTETVFHNDDYFRNASWMAGTNPKQIRILGPCTVTLNNIPRKYAGDLPKFPIPPTGIDQVTFEREDCLGYSVKLYADENYNENTSARFGVLTDSHKSFFDNIFRYLTAQNDVVVGFESMNNMANSLKTTNATQNPEDLAFQICINKDFKECSSMLSAVTIDNLATVTYTDNSQPPKVTDFNDKTSSIQFSSKDYRQAGVIAFEHTNFRGRYETFIASDLDVTEGNTIALDSPGKPRISSMIIVGAYRVWLSTGEFLTGKDYKGNDPSIITVNTAIKEPCITSQIPQPNDPTPGAQFKEARTQPIPKNMFKGNVLYINDLHDTNLFCRKYKNDDPDDECEKEQHYGDRIQSIAVFIKQDFATEQGISDISVSAGASQTIPYQVDECGEISEYIWL